MANLIKHFWKLPDIGMLSEISGLSNKEIQNIWGSLSRCRPSMNPEAALFSRSEALDTIETGPYLVQSSTLNAAHLVTGTLLKLQLFYKQGCYYTAVTPQCSFLKVYPY